MIQTGERAGFVRQVSPGHCSRTIHDLDDGFGGKAGACPDSTLPWDHENSEPVGWIRGHTKIGPVRQVKDTYHSEQFGIEIQAESMKSDGSLTWIFISRGMNKCVGEILQQEGEFSYQEEMANGSDIGKPIATNKRGSRVHTPTMSLRCPYQLTNGSVTFLPSITSSTGPCLVRYGHLREDDGAIGILCYLRYAAISKKKMPEDARIRNG